MAHCVPILALDGDLVPAEVCAVHTHYAPCPRDGEPASPLPMHVDGHLGRGKAIQTWQQHTGGQRPLVIHVGHLDETHDISDALPPICPCGPEFVPPIEAVAG